MTQKVRMREALRLAITDEMATDQDVIVLGEDVAAAGGVFKVTDGLLEEFGPNRVLDTPISEMGFLGAAVGAAATGLRPIVEIMFVEFMGVALDQLILEAAQLRYLSRGAAQVPMVLRATVGGGLGFGCQHSQVMDSLFRGVPGLVVCMPSTPDTAYGMLREAIRLDDPVVFLEHKALYPARGEINRSDKRPKMMANARFVRRGDELTVLAAGGTVSTAEEAIEASNTSADLIDLHTLSPWDRRSVLESVEHTGRVLAVQEGPPQTGWAESILTVITEQIFGSLTAPPARITSPPVPIPFAKDLEDLYMPSTQVVGDAIEHIMQGRSPTPRWQAALVTQHE